MPPDAPPTLIDDIYAAALGDHGWDVPLHQLRQLAEVRLVTLLSLDEASYLPAITAAAGDDPHWVAACFDLYQREFYRHDPAPAAIGDWPAGRWYDDAKVLPAAQRASSVFYQEFLRPHQLGSWGGVFVQRGPANSAFLALLGGPNSPGLSDAQRYRLGRLCGHLDRALRIQQRLDESERRATLAESTLDALPMPMLLLDGNRQLLLANRAAHALIDREPALRFVRGRFAPAGCSEPAQWQARCAQGMIVLPRADGTTLALTLAPVPPSSLLARSWQRPLTLMLGPGVRSRGERVQCLRTLYGLTPAEAELAVMLSCDDLSPQACAEQRQVSISTVRSQIKAIQLKLGLSRLAQVVRLVLTL